MKNKILSKYQHECVLEANFGLLIHIEDDMSHREILELRQSKDLQKLLEDYGVVIFEGTGVEDAYNDLDSKKLDINNINKSLHWHIDKKLILTMYYPIDSWRPCDLIISKKHAILGVIKKSLQGVSIEEKLKIRVEHTINTTDIRCEIDINIGIAELACLNSHIEYESVVTNLLEKQLVLLKENAIRLAIKKEKCQIIFCQDTSKGDFCHGRIRNYDREYSFKEKNVDYFYPKSGAVAMYPDSLNSCKLQ